MKLLKKLRAVLRNVFQRSDVDAEDAEEIDAYLNLLADEFAVSSVSREEAERQARIHCGGRSQLQQSVRAVRTGIELDLWWQDIRFGFRQFRRQWLLTVTSLATLAIGMGATITVFSAVYSLLIRSPRFDDPGRLVTVSIQFPDAGRRDIFAPDFAALRSGAVLSFESTAGYVIQSDVNLTGGRVPQRVGAIGITSNLMPTLGVRPQLGRDISDAEDVPDGVPVILLSDRLWRNQFGADKNLIGKSILLNAEPRTVIGVLPPDFTFPDPSIEPDVYMPASLPLTTGFSNEPVRPVNVIARLRKGVEHSQAEAEAKAFYAARVKLYPPGRGLASYA